MKKTIIAPKTEGKLKIEDVGTFHIDALRDAKAKKAQLIEDHPQLSAEQHETLWKAISKGEMPETEQDNTLG